MHEPHSHTQSHWTPSGPQNSVLMGHCQRYMQGGVSPNICSCTHSNIPQTSLTKHVSKNKIIKTLNPSRGPSEHAALCGFRSSSPWNQPCLRLCTPVCVCVCSHVNVLQHVLSCFKGFPDSSVGKETACNAGDPGSIPWVGKIPWRRNRLPTPVFLGFPCGSAERIHLQCGRPWFDPWVENIPWRRERLPTPVFWPGEFRGLYSPWGPKELDMTEQLTLHLSCFKVFISLAVSGLSSPMWALSWGMWDLVLWPGTEPGTPALGALSLSYWTTREILCIMI